MSRLERAYFYRNFWKNLYCQTFLQGAYTQMMRYQNYIAELMGYHSDYN